MGEITSPLQPVLNTPYSIDDIKKTAARESISMPRYIILAGWEK